MNSRGLHGATRDIQRIARFWELHPHANIGLRTGPENGLLIVDIDIDHGGGDSIAELAATNDEGLPCTLETETSSGGSHLYYQWPDGVTDEQLRNSAGKLGSGVDIRAGGGYVVAPPSLHRSGQRYRWCTAETEPQPAPRWVVDQLLKPTKPPEPIRPRRAPLPFAGRPASHAYIETAVQAELRQLEETGRHDALTRSAFRLGQLAHLGIPEDETIEALTDAALVKANPPKSRPAAIRTAGECFKAGKDHPREPSR